MSFTRQHPERIWFCLTGCSVCSASATNIWRCLSYKPDYMGTHWSGNQEVEVGEAPHYQSYLFFCRNLVSFPCNFKLRWLEILVLSLRMLLYEDIGISQLPPSSGAQAHEFRDPDICTVTPTS